MLYLIIYLTLALFFSFLCSVMEAVLLSTPVSFLKLKEKSGHRSAKVFIRLKHNIDKPLSAILTVNTVAHTVGAAGVGAQAAIVFGEAYFGLISAILTILILVFSEIIPKTIGAVYWRELSMVSARIINAMVIVTYPVVIISEFITKTFARRKSEKTVSREDISALANIGTIEGVFKEGENKIIQNLIRLSKVKITDIMTPRVVVSLADENITLAKFIENKDFLHFSRIPVYSGNTDNVVGYVLRQQIFEKIAEKNDKIKLKDIKRKIEIVESDTPILSVWELLLEKREHIALIIDEYGGMSGVITMEDIIETLLGLEIVDEKDKIKDMQEYARQRWKKKKMRYNFLKKFKD